MKTNDKRKCMIRDDGKYLYEITLKLNHWFSLKYWLNRAVDFFQDWWAEKPMEQKMVGHFLKWWAHCRYYSKTCLKWPLKK